ncbi:MAG: glycoside hydrolase family 31 protein [Bryobacterales bacterium]|nr:glycoside hydrolase family 31 protein [Bryobacterales bacterium]
MNGLNRVACLVLISLPALLAELRLAGNVTGAKPLPGGIELTLDSGGLARVDVLRPGMIRFRFSPSGKLQNYRTGAVILNDEPNLGTLVTEADESIIVRTSAAVITIRKKPFQVEVNRRDGSLVLADDQAGTGWDDSTGLVFTRKVAPQGESYFGLGARGGPIDRRGRVIVMHNVDRNAYTEFTDPLYISIPFFYGVRDGRAWGLFLDNPADPYFDLDAAQNGLMTLGAAKGELDYYVFVGPEPWTVSAAYSELTGPTPLPPLWALGFHQSRYGYKSQDEFISVAQRLRRERFPCDILWFDIDYMDRQQDFTWNAKTFPNPVEMNRSLDQLGFKRINIVEPLIGTSDANWPYLDATGLFLRNPDGTSNVSEIWYGDVSFIDFTNPAARFWYKLALSAFMDKYAINGLWQDLNEPAQNFMPTVLHDNDGQPLSDLEARNTYAFNMAKTSWETMREIRPTTRPWAISRSGYSGIQRYSANWSGDTLSTFDSLRVSLQMTISMGVSGQNFFGHDIGGFLGSPSAELFYRWMQFGSMIPLFRNHATDTSDPRELWSFGPQVAANVRDVINFRYQLLPYLYTAFKDTTDSGLPLVAPLWFYYPADERTFREDTSFLLGRDLLVAPVITEGANARTIYLPKGDDWVNFHANTIIAGGQTVMASAPVGLMPLFVRAGSVIVMGPIRQSVKDNSGSSLTVLAFPGATEGAAEVYEDDGESTDYEKGSFNRTRFEQYQVAGGRVVVVKRVATGFARPARNFSIRFRAMANKPAQVQVNGVGVVEVDQETKLDSIQFGWWYDAQARTLVVRVPDQDNLQVTALP